MSENAIIAEIHRHREKVARDCDFDAAKVVAYYRRRELERKDDSHPLVELSPDEAASTVLREEPPIG